MMDRGGAVGLMGVVAVAGSNWFDGGCVCGSVCVVMGLDRWIGVSWVCVCGSVC